MEELKKIVRVKGAYRVIIYTMLLEKFEHVEEKKAARVFWLCLDIDYLNLDDIEKIIFSSLTLDEMINNLSKENIEKTMLDILI